MDLNSYNFYLESEKAELEDENILDEHTTDLEKLPTKDVKKLIHELQVHQIELETQNEELRRIQDELKESRNRYSNLYDFSPVGYFTLDKNGIILEVNLTGANKLGTERIFLIEKPFHYFIDPGSKEVFYLHLKQVFSSDVKKTCEIKIVGKNDNQFDCRLESMAVWQNNSRQCRTAIVDITELKKTEKKLTAEMVERKKAEQAEKDARLYAESIIETLRECLLVLDPQLRVIRTNQSFYKTFKVTPEETLNKFIYDLGTRQWDRPELINLLEDIISKNTPFQDFEIEYEFPGIGRRTMLLNARHIHQSYSSKDLILLAIEDITEKKRLEAQLIRSQRMESIGTLASGIAHDLNNVLTPIVLSLQMLKKKYNDEQSQKLLTIIEQNSQRGANLIKQVMSFARGIEGERKPLQITQIISEIEKIAKETFPKDIEVQINTPADIWKVLGDATQIHQIIMNLSVNARDAMPDGGTLNISTDNFFIDENYVKTHNSAKVGRYVIITVSDTGTGIPPKIIDRIFEPFFTTKDYGKGTGLGLSTALAIVKSHGGFINVYSEVGKGTAFRVYLPAMKTETEIKEAEEKELELLNGNGEWILLVEDEDPIRDVTFSTLETYGYKVLTAKDGAEAVVLYTQNINKIKAILMDMMMPVMDGNMSIRAIKRINPDVKIIAVSGLTEKDRLSKVVNNANTFLQKPYTAKKLLKAIHDVLE